MEEEKECCPKFNPERWDKKTFNWENKLFVKEDLPVFFHIPSSKAIGQKIPKMINLATNANKLDEDKEETLMLFHDFSAFKSEILISVTGNVPEANNVSLSGTFMSRVYEGEFKAVPKFIKEMNKYLEENGKKAETYYIHYAYCPNCAKKFGNNYMILFAKIKD